ncbi:hypothetical protein PILCRDRAFT_818890 [Piloderma croceum F 1598]|uniref:Uncharacterized protein n=1 Tax=Piloderma croceum (strain F 1598) TaxID=765440 RepID=A0A0C3FWC8_PILCF|nr:hypothetical protein PILCRDRAFT_818890 [Piloderma croceum F 1598]
MTALNLGYASTISGIDDCGCLTKPFHNQLLIKALTHQAKAADQFRPRVYGEERTAAITKYMGTKTGYLCINQWIAAIIQVHIPSHISNKKHVQS